MKVSNSLAAAATKQKMFFKDLIYKEKPLRESRREQEKERSSDKTRRFYFFFA